MAVLPDACSGLMYVGVPRIVPVSVASLSNDRAIPKSIIFATPARVIRML
jgi:hypothetical protein